MAFGDTVTIENVEATGETEKALFVKIDGEEHCIPKSQIDDDSEVYAKGHAGRLVVTEWIASQKGIG